MAAFFLLLRIVRCSDFFPVFSVPESPQWQGVASRSSTLQNDDSVDAEEVVLQTR